MGGESSSGGEFVMRYSPVVEDNYQAMMWYALGGDAVTNSIIGAQPYTFPLADFIGAFYDLYYNYYRPRIHEFGIDRDIRDNLVETQLRLVDSTVVNNQILAHAQYLEDDINQVVLPKLRAGLRDIGAVMSSSFLDAQALVEANKQKTVSKFSVDLKMKMFDLAQDAWIRQMDWNWKIVNYQVNLLDVYYKIGTNYTKMWNDAAVGNTLFPFTVLDQVRAMVGALNGAQGAKSGKETMSMSGIQATAQYVGMAASMASMAGGISNALGSGADATV